MHTIPWPRFPASVSRLIGLWPLRSLALAAGVALSSSLAFQPLQARTSGPLFQALDLDQNRFVLVAAPIGDGAKAQLNIYEQVRPARPCFAIGSERPATVKPLLASFDFTGICSRYIDANGYSLRVGDADLATSYRLWVVRAQADNLLMAIPTRAGAGPEMVLARSLGAGNGFLQLVFEPGWLLKRRAYAGRALGHVYLYRATWPVAVAGLPPSPSPARPAR